MGQKYQMQQRVSTYHCLPSALLSPVAVLNWFQEAAQSQCEALGLGFDYMDAKDLGWIVTRYDINFIRYPEYGEDVVVETEPMGLVSFAALRKFWLKNSKGEILIEGMSEWMLYDRTNGKVVRPDSIEEFSQLDSVERARFRLKRQKPLGESAQECPYRIRSIDIDHNRHVNNATYLMWALDSLPFDLIREAKIRRIQIIFKDQAFYGGSVKTRTEAVDEFTYRVDVVDEDRLLTQFLIEFEKPEN